MHKFQNKAQNGFICEICFLFCMEDNKKQVQLEPDVEDMLKTSEAIIKQSVVSGESYMPDSHEFGCSHPSQ